MKGVTRTQAVATHYAAAPGLPMVTNSGQARVLEHGSIRAGGRFIGTCRANCANSISPKIHRKVAGEVSA